jgi:putative membrane protein
MKYFNQRLVIFLCLMSGSLVVFAQQGSDHYGSNMWWNDWHGVFFAPVFMIIFLVLIILSVVFLVRWLGGRPDGDGFKSPAQQDPLNILKKRFASGDIDKDEFIERRQLLLEK